MDERQYCKMKTMAVADYLYQEVGLHPSQNHYRIVGNVSGPRVLTLNITINPRYVPKISGMAQQLSMAAGMDGGSQMIRVAPGKRGTLTLEIPKPESMWRTVAVTALPHRRGLRIPLGLDGEYRPVALDFTHPLTAHLLTAGTTGCGKTNNARLLVYNLATQNSPDDVQVLLFNTVKPWNWKWFDGVAHLAHPVIADDTDALRTLAWSVAEMDDRGRNGRSKPDLFLIVDEAQALLDRQEFVGPIDRIAAIGRELGVHLVLCTQNPTAQQLGSSGIKSNMPTRLLGKFESAQRAAVAAGIPQTKAECLTAAGDNVFVHPAGVTRITTALVREPDTTALPRREQVPLLDLGAFEDVDHVLNQTTAPRQADLDPGHVAIAMARQCGITRLTQELGIGSKRARRVKAFADLVLVALRDLGYTVIPHTTDVGSGV
jgi:hypothetical protein